MTERNMSLRDSLKEIEMVSLKALQTQPDNDDECQAHLEGAIDKIGKIVDSNRKTTVESARCDLESLTNRFGSRADLESLAIRMATMHRTLVQSFTGGFVIPFMRELARMKRAGRFDARNEGACRACLIMCEALEKEYGICEGDEFAFPLV